MIEILDESQPWEIIPLPNEDVYGGRDLEAREGPTAVKWWAWDNGSWTDGDDYDVSLLDVMECCQDNGWVLYSIPAPAEPAAPEHDTEFDDDGGN